MIVTCKYVIRLLFSVLAATGGANMVALRFLTRGSRPKRRLSGV